tara:strand:+ start:549 stop:674 length:126 start_codon:yes stop_codon:yes gene_type:complete
MGWASRIEAYKVNNKQTPKLIGNDLNITEDYVIYLNIEKIS